MERDQLCVCTHVWVCMYACVRMLQLTWHLPKTGRATMGIASLVSTFSPNWWRVVCREVCREGREQLTHAYTHTHNPLPNNLVATPAFTTAMGPPPAVSTGCTGSSTVGTLPGDIAGCVVTMVTGIAPAGKRVGGAGSKPPNQEKGWTQVIIHVHNIKLNNSSKYHGH